MRVGTRNLAILGLLLAALGGTAAADAGAGGGHLFAMGVPVCKQHVQHRTHRQRGHRQHRLRRHRAVHMRCFAMRRVFVKAGTPGAHAVTPLGTTPDVTVGPAGGLTPSDLTTAYGLPATATSGTGQTVAIVDAFNDPNIATDLAHFDSQYGLAACALGTASTSCLRVVNQTGAAATPGSPANDTSGWSAEESMDVEAVHAICQGCHIILVEATSDSSSDLAIAENEAAALGATEITNSFGSPEASNATFQAAFNHPRVVITASTGDNGYYDYDKLFNASASPSANKPSTPAAFSTVVAVGGTSLYLGQTAARQSETVWNDNGPLGSVAWNYANTSLGASGGGCSTLFAAPAWQTHQSVWSTTACATRRLTADVAALADPVTGFDVYDTYNCGTACTGSLNWSTGGGTSLASPIVAAIYALAGGAHGISYPALTLYGHVSSAYDVTVGGIGFCDGEGAAQCNSLSVFGNTTNLNLETWGVLDCAWTASGAVAAGDRACDALPGYDGASGVGAPKGLTMFAKTGPTNKAVNVPATIKHGVSGTYSVTVSDPFPGGTSSPASYTWSWGDGTTTTTSTASTTHTYSSAGSKTITVTFKDAYYAQGVAAASKARSITVG